MEYKLVIQSSTDGYRWRDVCAYPPDIDKTFIGEELAAWEYFQPNKKFKIIRRRYAT